jgi:hypothetical protein
MHVGGIFTDLTKAFDCVNHEILLVQLQFYGIRHVAEDWFRGYVRNWRQNVEVTSTNSTKTFFLCPYYIETWSSPRINSSLSVVHNIYLDDLSLRINCISQSVLFAGDSSVIISSRNVEDFCSMSHLVFSCVIKLLAANNFVLKELMQFITNNSSHSRLHIVIKRSI